MNDTNKSVKEWPDNMPLENQVDRLVDFLIINFGDEIGKNGGEGAIECAVRLLSRFYSTLIDKEVLYKKLWELRMDMDSVSRIDQCKVLLQDLIKSLNL